MNKLRRPTDILGLIIQMALPLFVLIALNPAVQSQKMTFLETRQQNQQINRSLDDYSLAEFEPWHVFVWDWILQQDEHSENWQQLIRDAVRAQNGAALSDNGKMMLGDAFYNTNEKQKAVNVWQSVGPPEFNRTLPKIVKTQRELRDFKGALGTIRLWIASDPGNAKIYAQEGIINSYLDPATAIPELNQALSLDSAGQKSVQDLIKVLSEPAPAQPEVYRQVLLGRTLENMGEWDIAFEVLNRATAQTPGYAEGWAFLSEAQRQLGKDELPALNRAVSLDPHSVAALSFMGLYWLRNNQPDQAYTCFLQLTQLEPQQALWQVQAGEALARKGQPGYAMVYYQKALDLAPDDPKYWSMLVEFCLEYNLELRRIGLPAVRHLVIMTPEDPAAYDLHGLVLSVLGDKDDALLAFTRGLNLDESSPRLLLDMGAFYADQQKHDEAFYYLSRAVEMGQKQNQKTLVIKAQSLLSQLQ